MTTHADNPVPCEWCGWPTMHVVVKLHTECLVALNETWERHAYDEIWLDGSRERGRPDTLLYGEVVHAFD